MSTKRIKFANTSIVDEDTIRDVTEILRSGKFISGAWNEKFSEAFAAQFTDCYVAPVASGSAALIASIKMVYGIYPQYARKLIVPELSFAATSFAVEEAGFMPVFCDVDAHGLIDWNVCETLMKADPRIVGIIPVHLYGQQVPIPQHMADKYLIVEDACQAHGVITTPVGATACFSFYPSKNLGAAGDAGAVVSADEDYITYIKRYVNYGDLPGVEKYVHSTIGNNLRMDEIQACVLWHKLQKETMAQAVARRQAQAEVYRDRNVKSYTVHENNSYHLYPILVRNRDDVVKRLLTANIEVGTHYPYNLRTLGGNLRGGMNSTIADVITAHVVTLPIGPHLLDLDIHYVCDIIENENILIEDVNSLLNA